MGVCTDIYVCTTSDHLWLTNGVNIQTCCGRTHRIRPSSVCLFRAGSAASPQPNPSGLAIGPVVRSLAFCRQAALFFLRGDPTSSILHARLHPTAVACRPSVDTMRLGVWCVPRPCGERSIFDDRPATRVGPASPATGLLTSQQSRPSPLTQQIDRPTDGMGLRRAKGQGPGSETPPPGQELPAKPARASSPPRYHPGMWKPGRD